MNFIERAKSQPEAFVQLYDAYAGKIYQYLLRRVGVVSDAEDLTSQTWESALLKIHSLRAEDESGFLAWIFSIARNELNQYFRNGKSKVYDELPEILEDEARGPVDLLKDQFDEEFLRNCLAALSKKQRECVELKYFGDLRNKEIALVLNISEKTVASNLSRALKSLEEPLKKGSNSSNISSS
jgi:RNA polymerase sigma-70 factor (ECF subfamily)